MQWVTPIIGDAFRSAEEALQETLFLALFQGLGEGAPGRWVTRQPVKQALLALPDPKKTAPDNWLASCVITYHLIATLRVHEELRTTDH